RLSEARGGVLATLGRFTPEARKLDHGVELIDGRELWPLVEPVLPSSLLDDARASALAQTRRERMLGWLVSLLLGMALAWLLAPLFASGPSPTMGPAGSTAAPAPQAPAEAPLPALPDDLLRP